MVEKTSPTPLDLEADEMVDDLISSAVESLQKIEDGLTKDGELKEAKNVKTTKVTIGSERFKIDSKKDIKFATDPEHEKYLEGKDDDLKAEPEKKDEGIFSTFFGAIAKILKELEKGFIKDGLNGEAAEAEDNVHNVVNQIKPTLASYFDFVEKYGKKYEIYNDEVTESEI